MVFMENNTFSTLEWDKITDELKEFCSSSLAKNRVSKIYPYTNIEKIEYFQTKTSNAVELIRKYSFPPLFGIYDLKIIIDRLKKNAILENIELLNIADSLRVSQSLKDYVSEYENLEGENNLVVEDIFKLYTNLRVQKEIERIIVDEDTIADDASKALYHIRSSIREKNEEAKSKLNSILKSDNVNLQDEFVTMRDGRYVVPVKVGAKSKVPGITHDISQSGQTVYIEPMVIVEINNKIRDLEIQETEEIRKILKNLSELVFAYHEDIGKNQYVLIDLDFTFAKAKYAMEKNYTKPLLNTDKIIDIKNAKHPLLKGKVIPIDISMGEKYKSLVITGPNTGGKTVTLKTLGLITLMAQSGLYVPCDEFSKIAIFNNIFTDIGDNQSIDQSLSTFSASMTNIVSILEKADDKSLVLFDELGNGTDPVEGAALAMSIIDTLMKKNSLVVSTTHYSELKLYAMSTEGVQNANVEFDVETLSPTYKLIIGRPGKSNAFEISRRLGLDETILSRADTYISNDNRDFEDIISDIEKQKLELDKQLDEANRQKIKYRSLVDNFNSDIDKKRAKAEREIEKYKEEAREILEKAIKESKEMIQIAKKQNKTSDSREIDRAYTKISDKYKEVSNSYNKKTLKKPKNDKIIDVKLGETVKVLSMDDLAVVQTLPDNKGDLTVQMGILKFNINIRDIAKTNEDIEQDKSQSSYRKLMKNISSEETKQELDLRGHNVEEAIPKIEQFFDTSILKGLKKVYVIHGKGTGALRKGVTEYFKKSNYVDEFRLGDDKEGGAGITVVMLK